MTQMPTGRYKIIERDRRLVTIDTLTGQEVVPGKTLTMTPQSSIPTDSNAITATSTKPTTKIPLQSAPLTGGISVTTSATFDLKGPRTLVIPPEKMVWLLISNFKFYILFLVVIIALFRWFTVLLVFVFFSQVRAWFNGHFKNSITEFFDRFDPNLA